MWNQIRNLASIQLYGIVRCNTGTASGNEKRKKVPVWVLLVIILSALVIFIYTCAATYFYVQMGIFEFVPSYLFSTTTVMIFLATMIISSNCNDAVLKSILEIRANYSALYLSICRFLSILLINTTLCLIIMLPGFAVYSYLIRPSVLTYVMIVSGVFLVTLIPMTVATLIGALINNFISNKSYRRTVLIIMKIVSAVILITALIYPFIRTGDIIDPKVAQISHEFLYGFDHLYMPSLLYSNGIVYNGLKAFALFSAISIFIAILFILNNWYKLKSNSKKIK